MQLAHSDVEILACYPALLELRPHLNSPRAFLEQVRRQQQTGAYQLGFVRDENGEVPAATGFRVIEFLYCGKIIYIDDLVTRESARKKGYAGALLKAVIELARSEGCAAVHLDSGYQRHHAHRLYLNHGFTLSSHHFALALK